MSENRHPLPIRLTVDVILFAPDGRGGRSVLLVRRARSPFAGMWAIPGGFVEIDEDLEPAARRELREETGIGAGRLVEVGTFGRPGRDPRGRTVSIVFAGRLPRRTRPFAGDDAREAAWFPLRALPPLAFDHAEILAAARRHRLPSAGT